MVRRLAYSSTSSSPAFLQIGLMAAGGVLLGVVVPTLVKLGPAISLFAVAALGLVVFSVVFDVGKRIYLLLLPFILPMDVDVHLLGGNLRISVINLTALFLCGLWLIELAGDRTKRVEFFPRTTLPALACLVAMALSLTANGGGVAMARTFGLVCNFLLYFYVANALRSESDIRAVVWALLLGALVQIVAAIAELGLGTELHINFSQAAPEIWAQQVGDYAYSRISGLMEHPNMLGIYLSTIVVFLISLIYAETGKNRWLRGAYWMGILLCVLVIVNTFSRSAWFVLAVFAPCVLLRYLWSAGNLHRAALPVVGCLVVVLIAGITSGSKISDRLTIDDSVVSRMYMMEIGANVVRHNPVFGVGHRNYPARMFEYDDTSTGLTTIFAGTLHNVYMLIAAEQGLLGLAAFLWLNAAIFLSGARLLKAPIGFLPNVGLSCWCLILMLLMFGMANPFPRYTYLYLPLGILVATLRLMSENESHTSQVRVGEAGD